MTIAEMLGQSGILTLLGMGVVFSFLIIMILGMNLLHAVLHALKLDKAESVSVPNAGAPTASAAPSAGSDQGAIVAAIAVALKNK